MNTNQPIRWLVLATATLLLAACAGTGTTTRSGSGATDTAASSSQDVLKQRAEQRWQYLIDKQADKAYDYLTPGYRKTVGRSDYASRMNHRPVNWDSVKVEKIECKAQNNCLVHVKVGYDAVIPGVPSRVRSVATIRERWLHIDNKWYNLPDKLGTSLK